MISEFWNLSSFKVKLTISSCASHFPFYSADISWEPTLWDNLLKCPGTMDPHRIRFLLPWSYRQEDNVGNTMAQWSDVWGGVWYVIQMIPSWGIQGRLLLGVDMWARLWRLVCFRHVEMRWKTFYFYRLTRAENTPRNFVLCHSEQSRERK